MEISVMFAKYSRYYDLFNQDKPYKKEIEFVYWWAKKPRTIFDIGCGTGNYWKYYPIKTKIFGVDKSRAMVELTDGKLFPNFKREIMCADITKFKMESKFDCATALFDVINYISKHDWWKNIPVKEGGYFIFDVFNSEKVYNDRFRTTIKNVKGISRSIIPINYNGNSVDLLIDVYVGKKVFREKHKIYIYNKEQLSNFCGKEFRIIEIKETDKWQQWWKLQKI